MILTSQTRAPHVQGLLNYKHDGSIFDKMVVTRAVAFTASLILHAEAVCRAVYICFLTIRDTFSKTDGQLLLEQKAYCKSAYGASCICFASIFSSNLMNELKKEPMTVAQSVNVEIHPLVRSNAITPLQDDELVEVDFSAPSIFLTEDEKSTVHKFERIYRRMGPGAMANPRLQALFSQADGYDVVSRDPTPTNAPQDLSVAIGSALNANHFTMPSQPPQPLSPTTSLSDGTLTPILNNGNASPVYSGGSVTRSQAMNTAPTVLVPRSGGTPPAPNTTAVANVQKTESICSEESDSFPDAVPDDYLTSGTQRAKTPPPTKTANKGLFAGWFG